MDNERIYEILVKFIKCAGMTNKSFAIYANIKPSSFQAMINRKSSMKTETAQKISAAMRHFISETECTEFQDIDHLKLIYVEYLTYCLRDSIVWMQDLIEKTKELIPDEIKKQFPHQDEVWEAAMSIADKTKDELSHIKSQESVIVRNTRSRLLSSFDQLNEKGQETAAERVEELTHIPAYQKPKN